MTDPELDPPIRPSGINGGFAVESPEPEEPEPESQPVGEPEEELPEFDPRYLEEFNGLMYLGRLTDSLTILGHKFVIRTLHDGDLLQVALITKDYQGTMGATRAYVDAIVAACVETVDGQPLPQPLGEADEIPLIHAFSFVTESWYSVVTDRIYERYLALEEKVRQVLDAMGKAPGSGA